MMRTIVIFEPGIMDFEMFRGAWRNWPNPAIAWAHNHTPYRAQTLLYFSDALFAARTRKKRATQFSLLLKQYSHQGWRMVVVAHSEGTATSLEAIEIAGYPQIAEVHLLCGAVSGNCHKNGINRMLKRDNVGKFYCYVAGQDGAMKIEDTLMGRWCFGIRTKDVPLGLKGPENCLAGPSRMEVVRGGRWQDFGHSDCFLPEHFETTMREVLHVQTSAPTPFEAALSPLRKK